MALNIENIKKKDENELRAYNSLQVLIVLYRTIFKLSGYPEKPKSTFCGILYINPIIHDVF